MANSLKKIIPLFMGLCLALTVSAAEVIWSFNVNGVNVLTIPVNTTESYRLDNILSDRSISIPNCREYNFIGWKINSPVEEGENPTTPPASNYKAKNAEVMPTTNMSFYAVYQKPGVSDNRFVRITSTRELRGESQYILACYYDHDGDIYYGPSYFAMKDHQTDIDEERATGTNVTVGNTSYELYSKKIYHIDAEQIYPDAGVVECTDNTIVWTLTGNEDAWGLTNGDGTKKLFIQDNHKLQYYKNWNPGRGWKDYFDGQLLTNSGNTFVISAANGAFNFRASNGYCLTYSDDAVDYFKTGTSNSWNFYLYKKESAYTSFPDCGDWTVHLDALDGTIDVDGYPHTYDQENVSKDGFSLPNALRPSDVACEGWTFAGWSAEIPIQGTTSDKFVGSLHAAGSMYKPTYDGEKLYAVYSKSETIYKRISSKTEVTQRTSGVDDEYIIVTYPYGEYEDKAISTKFNSGANWDLANITIDGGIITLADAAAAGNVVWKYNGTCFMGKNTNKPLSYNQGNSQYYLLQNDYSPFNLQNSNYSNYHLYWMANRTNEDNQDMGNYVNYKFYIYKKEIMTTYISYPHCTPYNITLHSCGGVIGPEGSTETTRTSPEGEAGLGISDLPSCTPRCPAKGWFFAGWLEGGELKEVNEVEFTGLHTEDFIPSHNNTDLYAVYYRDTTKFPIIDYHDVSNMVEGQNYLITFLVNGYDYEISSDEYSSIALKGYQGVAPQDATTYYMQESDSTRMWTLSGSEGAWKFKNLKTGKYLHVNTSTGDVTTDDIATEFTITPNSTSGYLNVYISAGEYYLYYDGEKFTTSTTAKKDSYLYRQSKVFTSWPHCQPFTLLFDPCDGTSATSKKEDYAYSGVELPQAYVNSDCSKEGWTFAGWATAPVTTESDVLTVDLLTPGLHYDLVSDSATLYAVYCLKEDTYQKVASVDDLKTGVNYIITNTAKNKALGYSPYSNNYIKAESVTDEGGIITNTDDGLNWRLQGRKGEYELYNPYDMAFLDMRNKDNPYVTFTPSSNTIHDNFLFYVTEDRVAIRSNRNLIVDNTGTKYLGYDAGSYFKLVNKDAATANPLYFYQQEALYHSYPSCAVDVDAVLWSKSATKNSMTIESYVLSGEPVLIGGSSRATDQAINQTGTAQDGTWLIDYSDAEFASGTTAVISWGGKNASIKIPYIVDADKTTEVLLGDGDHSAHNVVVLSGKTLTVSEDRTIHTLTVQEGATLSVSNDVTLTVNALVLGANGDQNAPMVNLNNNGSIVLKNDELYYDLRIPADRYYWFSLPFNSQTKEISYSNVATNGGIPVYFEDFFVYYYDGASRATDADSGEGLARTYWTPVAEKGGDYTMQFGQGYLIGIADQNDPQDDDRIHTKRVMRFTMRPPLATWLGQERTEGIKVTTVVPSTASSAVHGGWNLIGNPFMHSYNTGENGGSGLSNGVWVKEYATNGLWTGRWIAGEGDAMNVPYLTIYNPSSDEYTQVPAANYNFRPFEAAFVQVDGGSNLNFEPSNMHANMPAYMRFMNKREEPVRTGVILSGVGCSDKTGFVLSDNYTTNYEIGADLVKYKNAGQLNLYTFNADNETLAFNGLSEEDAVNPIPVGITFPQAGEYTFAFDDEWYAYNAVESLILIDYVEGMRVNLKNGYYTFTTNAGTVNDRFAIIIRLAKGTTTDIDPAVGFEDGETHKIIKDNHLYIIRDNEMYNAMGGRVK